MTLIFGGDARGRKLPRGGDFSFCGSTTRVAEGFTKYADHGRAEEKSAAGRGGCRAQSAGAELGRAGPSRAEQGRAGRCGGGRAAPLCMLQW